jgi:hypothetical protein
LNRDDGPWTAIGVIGPDSAPPYNLLPRCDPRSNRCRGVSVVASQQEDRSPSLSGLIAFRSGMDDGSSQVCTRTR